MELENISEHLQSLSKQEWQKLFDLVPLIESCDEFIKSGGIEEDSNDPDGFIITPVIEVEVVLDFESIMYELDLVIPFSWPDWNYGKKVVRSGNYNNLDTVTLLKILTAFIRNNRFCDGVLASRFQDRTIEKILKEIKKNIEANKYM